MVKYLVRVCFLTGLLAFLTGCSGTKNTVTPYAVVKLDTSFRDMVVTAHPLATQAGLNILKAGGNAFDAAVAVEFALAVCYPRAGNLGGGGFMMLYSGKGLVDMLDYREVAPIASTPAMYQDRNGNVIKNLSLDGHKACGVPGTVAGMYALHEKYGRLPWAQLVQPSIDLASKGILMTRFQADILNESMAVIDSVNTVKNAFNKHKNWKSGDKVIQADLAATLTLIRDLGQKGFYEGKTAQLIADEMKRGGGIMTTEDLKSYKPAWRVPVRGFYNNCEVYTTPLPSGGGISLIEMLNILKNFPLASYGFQSAKSIHTIVEAERFAFEDRNKHLGDKDFINFDESLLLNRSYAKMRADMIDTVKAGKSLHTESGKPEKEETTHYSIVDVEGNAVSATTTLNGNFGSKVVIGGAGFFMNNEMDDFSVKPGSPNLYGLVGSKANEIRPRKKPLSSMCPVIVVKDKKLYMVLGTPGGSTIPTTNLQIILNVLDYHKSLYEAVQAPRFHSQWLPDEVYIEQNSFDSSVISRLKAMGHVVTQRKQIGLVEAIMIDHNGNIIGVADRRGDDHAQGN